MAEITASPGKRKTGFSKSINRRSTRIDLTPMVDLGFLLITFFVFTTSLSEVKVMDMAEVHDGPSMPVPLSGAMTIILGKEHRIYYYYGQLNEHTAIKQVKEASLMNIRELILQKKNQTPMDKLMYVIKTTKEARFRDCVDLLDEIAICGIPAGHYAEVDITKEETGLIEAIE